MSNKLVAYFSASGVTAKVAETLAEAIGADISRSSRRRLTQKLTWTGWTRKPAARLK